MKKLVAISIEGKIEVHAGGHPSGAYATMCGLDGADLDQLIVELPRKPRINCTQCRALWEAWKAFSARDFALP